MNANEEIMENMKAAQVVCSIGAVVCATAGGHNMACNVVLA
jgi:hypothetical protein